MAIHFHQTSQFEEMRARIEQHLYDSVLELHQEESAAIRSVEEFSCPVERLFDTLEQMYQTPGPKDAHSEKSFPIQSGRYRVFFKVTVRPNGDFEITMLDIDDNRQSNLERFPSHRLISFDSDDDYDQQPPPNLDSRCTGVSSAKRSEKKIETIFFW